MAIKLYSSAALLSAHCIPHCTTLYTALYCVQCTPHCTMYIIRLHYAKANMPYTEVDMNCLHKD